ncbi:MAG: MFS transporter, partial [Candidatus Omnitrophica bacterium]|nr:MFS transporter [Candidatus Omnitrophota bacterium]
SIAIYKARKKAIENVLEKRKVSERFEESVSEIILQQAIKIITLRLYLKQAIQDYKKAKWEKQRRIEEFEKKFVAPLGSLKEEFCPKQALSRIKRLIGNWQKPDLPSIKEPFEQLIARFTNAYYKANVKQKNSFFKPSYLLLRAIIKSTEEKEPAEVVNFIIKEAEFLKGVISIKFINRVKNLIEKIEKCEDKVEIISYKLQLANCQKNLAKALFSLKQIEEFKKSKQAQIKEAKTEVKEEIEIIKRILTDEGKINFPSLSKILKPIDTSKVNKEEFEKFNKSLNQLPKERKTLFKLFLGDTALPWSFEIGGLPIGIIPPGFPPELVNLGSVYFYIHSLVEGGLKGPVPHIFGALALLNVISDGMNHSENTHLERYGGLIDKEEMKLPLGIINIKQINLSLNPYIKEGKIILPEEVSCLWKFKTIFDYIPDLFLKLIKKEKKEKVLPFLGKNSLIFKEALNNLSGSQVLLKRFSSSEEACETLLPLFKDREKAEEFLKDHWSELLLVFKREKGGFLLLSLMRMYLDKTETQLKDLGLWLKPGECKKLIDLRTLINASLISYGIKKGWGARLNLKERKVTVFAHPSQIPVDLEKKEIEDKEVFVDRKGDIIFLPLRLANIQRAVKEAQEGAPAGIIYSFNPKINITFINEQQLEELIILPLGQIYKEIPEKLRKLGLNYGNLVVLNRPYALYDKEGQLTLPAPVQVSPKYLTKSTKDIQKKLISKDKIKQIKIEAKKAVVNEKKMQIYTQYLKALIELKKLAEQLNKKKKKLEKILPEFYRNQWLMINKRETYQQMRFLNEVLKELKDKKGKKRVRQERDKKAEETSRIRSLIGGPPWSGYPFIPQIQEILTELKDINKLKERIKRKQKELSKLDLDLPLISEEDLKLLEENKQPKGKLGLFIYNSQLNPQFTVEDIISFSNHKVDLSLFILNLGKGEPLTKGGTASIYSSLKEKGVNLLCLGIVKDKGSDRYRYIVLDSVLLELFEGLWLSYTGELDFSFDGKDKIYSHHLKLKKQFFNNLFIQVFGGLENVSGEGDYLELPITYDVRRLRGGGDIGYETKRTKVGIGYEYIGPLGKKPKERGAFEFQGPVLTLRVKVNDNLRFATKARYDVPGENSRIGGKVILTLKGIEVNFGGSIHQRFGLMRKFIGIILPVFDKYSLEISFSESRLGKVGGRGNVLTVGLTQKELSKVKIKPIKFNPHFNLPEVCFKPEKAKLKEKPVALPSSISIYIEDEKPVILDKVAYEKRLRRLKSRIEELKQKEKDLEDKIKEENILIGQKILTPYTYPLSYLQDITKNIELKIISDEKVILLPILDTSFEKLKEEMGEKRVTAREGRGTKRVVYFASTITLIALLSSVIYLIKRKTSAKKKAGIKERNTSLTSSPVISKQKFQKEFHPMTLSWLIFFYAFITGISNDIILVSLPHIFHLIGKGYFYVTWVEAVAIGFLAVAHLICGYLSDRLKKRFPFLVVSYLGYLLSFPLYFFKDIFLIFSARSVQRFVQRIRAAPVGAMLAIDCPGHPERPFPLCRAGEVLGGFIGIIMGGLLFYLKISLEGIILTAGLISLFGFIPLLRLSVLIDETQGINSKKSKVITEPEISYLRQSWKVFKDLKGYLSVVALFGLANFTPLCFMIKGIALLNGLGIVQSPSQAYIFGIALLGVYRFSSFAVSIATLFFSLKEKTVKRYLFFGYLGLTAGCLGFIFSNSLPIPFFFIILSFVFTGSSMGLIRAYQRGYVARFVKKYFLGRAFGIYHFVLGFLSAIANIAAFLLWTEVSPSAPFIYAGLLSILAAIFINFVKPPKKIKKKESLASSLQKKDNLASSSFSLRELADRGDVFLKNMYERLYIEIQIQQLKEKYKNLKGLKVLHLNTTKEGGGVAELLGNLVPLSGKVGIKAGWEVFEGSSGFFNFTKKKLHNGLQGNRVELSEDEKEFYKIVSGKEFKRLEKNFKDLDIVICHDPQTAGIIPLIKENYPHIKIIWRCHIDLSSPDREVWKFIYEFVRLADKVVFHTEEFIQKDLPCEKIVIMPASINPLSPKNREIPQKLIREVLEKYQINPHKPIILQVSRFDPFKGQEVAMRVFEEVRKEIDCQLVLASNFPRDDAEGLFIFGMFKSLRERYKFKEDISLIRLESEGEENALEVNALQRAAYLVVHLAQKEGFGLVVTEAMWKRKPVVATNCGGIKFQIENGKSGFLVENREEAKSKILQLFENTNLARRIGEEAGKRVRKEFLTAKHLERYLETFDRILSSSSIIVRLKRSCYNRICRGGSFKREGGSFTSPWLAGSKIFPFSFFRPSFVFTGWRKWDTFFKKLFKFLFYFPSINFTFLYLLGYSNIRTNKQIKRTKNNGSITYVRRRIFKKKEGLWKDLVFRIWKFLAYFLQKEVIFFILKFLKHIFPFSFSLIGRARCTESLKTGGFFLLKKLLLLSRERWKNINIFTISHNYLSSTSSAIEISIDEFSLGLLILFNRPLYIKDIWRWTDKMRKILKGIIEKSLSDEGLLEETVRTIFPDLDLSKVSKVNVIALGSGKESEPEKIGSESIFKVRIDNKGDFVLVVDNYSYGEGEHNLTAPYEFNNLQEANRINKDLFPSVFGFRKVEIENNGQVLHYPVYSMEFLKDYAPAYLDKQYIWSNLEDLQDDFKIFSSCSLYEFLMEFFVKSLLNFTKISGKIIKDIRIFEGDLMIHKSFFKDPIFYIQKNKKDLVKLIEEKDIYPVKLCALRKLEKGSLFQLKEYLLNLADWRRSPQREDFKKEGLLRIFPPDIVEKAFASSPLTFQDANMLNLSFKEIFGRDSSLYFWDKNSSGYKFGFLPQEKEGRYIEVRKPQIIRKWKIIEFVIIQKIIHFNGNGEILEEVNIVLPVEDNLYKKWLSKIIPTINKEHPVTFILDISYRDLLKINASRIPYQVGEIKRIAEYIPLSIYRLKIKGTKTVVSSFSLSDYFNSPYDKWWAEKVIVYYEMLGWEIKEEVLRIKDIKNQKISEEDIDKIISILKEGDFERVWYLLYFLLTCTDKDLALQVYARFVDKEDVIERFGRKKTEILVSLCKELLETKISSDKASSSFS